MAANCSGSTRQLTNDNIVFHEMPQWSGDGNLIACLSGDAGQAEIYVMDSDGNGLRQITTDGTPKSYLRWRP